MHLHLFQQNNIYTKHEKYFKGLVIILITWCPPIGWCPRALAQSRLWIIRPCLHCIIELKYGQRFTSFPSSSASAEDRVLVFSWGLHHNACHVRLHLSCDFSASLFSCPLFTAVFSRKRFFFYSVINVL